MAGEELLRIPIKMDLEYRYPTGKHFTHFFRVLKEEGKIMALKCPKCGYVFLPPRPACGECHATLEEWVQVSDKGTVKAFTAIHFKFYDANLGRERPVPFGSALIQLDGADSLLNHYLEENDVTKMHIGMRVQAVFREQRQGNIGDILYFRTIQE